MKKKKTANKKPANKKPAQKKLSRKEKIELQNELQNDFFMLEMEEIKKTKQRIRRSARYYIDKGNKKKGEAKMRSLVYFNEVEKEINRQYGKDEKRKSREKELKEYTGETFFADFEFNERNKIIDFVFKNVEVKKIFGKNKNLNMDSILKKIDSILSKLTYSELFIIEIDLLTGNILSFYSVDKSEFENL